MNPLSLEVLQAPGTVLLDTARPDEVNARTLLFTEPLDVLTAHTLDEVEPLLEALDAAVNDGYHLAGVLSYEAGYAFEDVDPPTGRSEPLGWFGVYEAPELISPPAVEAFWQEADDAPLALTEVTFSLDRAGYLEAIDAIKTHIREGDVYQINYTGAVTFRLDGPPWALYRALRGQQRVPYSAFLNIGDVQILSLSPELFFRRDGQRICTRPMKGTIHRGRTLAEDQALREALQHDEKSRAENLMIVDLLRNDLSVCCTPGSVEVPALFTTEPYDTVTQMTSTVEGQLQPGTRYADLFRALFPCGSVTGAPKIRAMDIISTLEEGPRGVYCGAIGYIAPDDTAAFNVAIRTAVMQDGRGAMGVGSGIVWDSDAEAEFEECRLKARFLDNVASATRAPDDFQLIETMRWEGSIALWDEHMERLSESAAYFGFAFDRDAARRAVAQHTAELTPGLPHKVRLTLDRWGALDVESDPLPESDASPLRFILADVQVESADPFRYHKTTRRGVYRRAYQQARAEGADEALLLNERGEVTEGARTNLFVEVDGALVTPPLDSGVLNGVYRRHVLATHPAVREQVLQPTDVYAAEAVYLCNAVRGWQRAEPAEPGPPDNPDVQIDTAQSS